MSELSLPFQQLADEIKRQAAGRPIVYVPNPGNYGDALIRYATKRFFSDHEIWHTEVNIGYLGGKYALLRFLAERGRWFFVYGGGGAWCESSAFGYRNARFIQRWGGSLLVLPSTYQLNPGNLVGTFYRRDNAESARNAPDSHFCHDMAFYLAAIPEGDRCKFPPPCERQLSAFRTDGESRHDVKALPQGNQDVSCLGSHMSNGDDFIRLVSRFSTVDTDRLHVGIAALLAGVKVRLYAGNYFKIRAIHHATMSLFPNDTVQFMEEKLPQF